MTEKWKTYMKIPSTVHHIFLKFEDKYIGFWGQEVNHNITMLYNGRNTYTSQVMNISSEDYLDV